MDRLPKIIKGDGLTPETAVLFEPCHVTARVRAEQEFISERYGTEHLNWVCQWHFTTEKGHSKWVIELDTGESIAFFFELGNTIYD